jgi:hypothetical protein
MLSAVCSSPSSPSPASVGMRYLLAITIVTLLSQCCHTLLTPQGSTEVTGAQGRLDLTTLAQLASVYHCSLSRSPGRGRGRGGGGGMKLLFANRNMVHELNKASPDVQRQSDVRQKRQ